MNTELGVSDYALGRKEMKPEREMRWRMNEWPEEMIMGKRIGSKFVGASFVSREKAHWDIQAKQKIKKIKKIFFFIIKNIFFYKIKKKKKDIKSKNK